MRALQPALGSSSSSVNLASHFSSYVSLNGIFCVEKKNNKQTTTNKANNKRLGTKLFSPSQRFLREMLMDLCSEIGGALIPDFTSLIPLHFS